jgi:hypothetical protein
MIVSLRKWLQIGKFVVAFVIFAYVLFHLLQVMSVWIEPDYRYREPAGRAVKVFHDQVVDVESMNAKERLKFFYWYGE